MTKHPFLPNPPHPHCHRHPHWREENKEYNAFHVGLRCHMPAKLWRECWLFLGSLCRWHQGVGDVAEDRNISGQSLIRGVSQDINCRASLALKVRVSSLETLEYVLRAPASTRTCLSIRHASSRALRMSAARDLLPVNGMISGRSRYQKLFECRELFQQHLEIREWQLSPEDI